MKANREQTEKENVRQRVLMQSLPAWLYVGTGAVETTSEVEITVTGFDVEGANVLFCVTSRGNAHYRREDIESFMEHCTRLPYSLCVYTPDELKDGFRYSWYVYDNSGKTKDYALTSPFPTVLTQTCQKQALTSSRSSK